MGHSGAPAMPQNVAPQEKKERAGEERGVGGGGCLSVDVVDFSAIFI